MNLVKMIQDQLSGDALGKLGSLIGADSEATERAASAAVPAVMAGLAGLASNEAGAKKVTTALESVGTGALGDIGQMLSGGGGSLIQQGQGLLGSLFGDNAIGGIANAIGRFGGLNIGSAKNLLAAIAPIVMKVIGSQWKSRGGTPSALTNLLAEQKANIADALPAGFSLPEIPGLAAAKDTIRSTTDSARRTAETAGAGARSVASWVIPLVVLAIGGYLLWNFLLRDRGANQAAQGGPKQVTAMRPTIPEAPTLAAMREEISGMFGTLGDTFTGIKDAASAEAALPKLEEINGKLDGFGKSIALLPQDARTSLEKVVDERLSGVRDQATKVLSLSGISEKVRQVIQQIVRKLEDWKVTRGA